MSSYYTTDNKTTINITDGVTGGGYFDSWVTNTGTNTLSNTLDTNDIIIDGRSFKKFMEDIDRRLAILQPNPALESRWDKLKQLRNEYQALEQELLEKEKVIGILKSAK